MNPGQERIPNVTLRVEDDRIGAISATAESDGPYAGAYVLPGLIDMHVHYPPEIGLGQTEH